MKPCLNPPWLDDPEPDAWVSIRVAAVFFDRTSRRIRQWCTEGTFAEAHIPTYFDGRYWYVRLSDARKVGQLRKRPGVHQLR